MTKSIKEARVLETEYPKEAGLFLDIMVGEGHWRQGRFAEASKMARTLLKNCLRSPSWFECEFGLGTPTVS